MKNKSCLTGRLDVFSCRHPELDSGSSCYKKQGEIPNQVWNDSIFYNNGFTLIELLVVVLIIGILAAVALPQYTQAVEKSRFATYRTLADSMVKAVEVFHLANGSWPTSLDELDMEFPADMNIENSISHGICRKNTKMYCCIIFPLVNNYYGSIRCGDNENHLSYSRRYAKDDGTSFSEMNCSAKDEKYKSVCKSISGKQTGYSVGVVTPTGLLGGYFGYNL